MKQIGDSDDKSDLLVGRESRQTGNDNVMINTLPLTALKPEVEQRSLLPPPSPPENLPSGDASFDAHRSFDGSAPSRRSNRRTISQRIISSCQDDFEIPADKSIPFAATHYQGGSSWASAPLPCYIERSESRESSTRLNKTSAMALFLTQRYHSTCTNHGGMLDSEHPAIGVQEIIYSGRNGTVLATIKEPKFRWVVVLVGLIMMLHAIPSLSLWRSGAMQHARHYRFSALELRGDVSPPDNPGVGRVGLRLGRCNIPIGDTTNVSSSGASITMSFASAQAMEGWYMTPHEKYPDVYPIRFKLEASDDQSTWRTVGAPSWTAVSGWFDFNVNAYSDGRYTWDLTPRFGWLVGQSLMPTTCGFLLLLSPIVGMAQQHIVAAEFLLYSSGVVSFILAAWSAGHQYVEKYADRNAQIECLIFACTQFILIVSVLIRPRAFLGWLLVSGCLAIVGDVLYLIATRHTHNLTFIRINFIAGILLNCVRLSWRAWKVASADKAVAHDRQRYEQERDHMSKKHSSTIQQLRERVDRWQREEDPQIPRHGRQLNPKRELVQKNSTATKGGVSEKGGFFQFSEARDPDSPVTSLDQVCLCVRSSVVCVCMHVCMHACMYVCMYENNTHTRSIHTHISIHTNKQTNTHTHTRIYTHK
jgi:hypothetical protein